ncbi:hypothetical protein GLOIN_2v1791175 [Rhizophagus irregularis DAOM 181602=DAOM 197198]|nr:hypothetical protein GLOIN_2v1791175 [Rhizophagus irregularis DAOM 181602=DAOM 197198]
MWLKANDITLNMVLVFEFKNFINMSLIKLFIENEVNLHTLDLEASNTNYDTYIEHILEIILQNPSFINNNIRNLKFSISSSSSKIVNRVTQIINSNQNLKKISFNYNTNTFHLYQSLLLSKESNCSNTLNTIIFYHIDFEGINNLDKIFEQLNVLESVHIIFCRSLDRFIQQIIKLTKPFKLKSLFLIVRLQIESLELLLQKSGQTLPSKLEYLSLVLHIKENDIEIFLKNSQDNFFNKLVIENKKQKDDNYIDILPYIKEYVIKKKRVKYLAIKNTLILGCISRKVDLFDLKDEVKELKLHNIKVLSYNKLSIGTIYRFLNEID